MFNSANAQATAIISRVAGVLESPITPNNVPAITIAGVLSDADGLAKLTAHRTGLLPLDDNRSAEPGQRILLVNGSGSGVYVVGETTPPLPLGTGQMYILPTGGLVTLLQNGTSFVPISTGSITTVRAVIDSPSSMLDTTNLQNTDDILVLDTGVIEVGDIVSMTADPYVRPLEFGSLFVVIGGVGTNQSLMYACSNPFVPSFVKISGGDDGADAFNPSDITKSLLYTKLGIKPPINNNLIAQQTLEKRLLVARGPLSQRVHSHILTDDNVPVVVSEQDLVDPEGLACAPKSRHKHVHIRIDGAAWHHPHSLSIKLANSSGDQLAPIVHMDPVTRAINVSQLVKRSCPVLCMVTSHIVTGSPSLPPSRVTTNMIDQMSDFSKPALELADLQNRTTDGVNLRRLVTDWSGGGPLGSDSIFGLRRRFNADNINDSDVLTVTFYFGEARYIIGSRIALRVKAMNNSTTTQWKGKVTCHGCQGADQATQQDLLFTLEFQSDLPDDYLLILGATQKAYDRHGYEANLPTDWKYTPAAPTMKSFKCAIFKIAMEGEVTLDVNHLLTDTCPYMPSGAGVVLPMETCVHEAWKVRTIGLRHVLDASQQQLTTTGFPAEIRNATNDFTFTSVLPYDSLVLEILLVTPANTEETVLSTTGGTRTLTIKFNSSTGVCTFNNTKFQPASATSQVPWRHLLVFGGGQVFVDGRSSDSGTNTATVPTGMSSSVVVHTNKTASGVHPVTRLALFRTYHWVQPTEDDVMDQYTEAIRRVQWYTGGSAQPQP